LKIRKYPALILQPLVENAVKHGFQQTGGPFSIDLDVKNVDGLILIEVNDSGPGFGTLGKEEIFSRGTGLSNIRDRLRVMIEELDSGISIIEEASDGKEAIGIVRNVKPDLLFLDIQMPVLDGFDVVELLGDDCPPVIFVTAYDEYAIKAFEVHAVDYILKPVRKERLEESVKRVMQNRGSSSRPDALKNCWTSVHSEI
jgi:CheY-like chemotaxis protein